MLACVQRLELLAEGLGKRDEGIADWLQTSLRIAQERRPAGPDFAAWIEDLQGLEDELVDAGLTEALEAELVVLQEAALWARIGDDIPEYALRAGRFAAIAEAVLAVSEGRVTPDDAAGVLAYHRTALKAHLRAHARTYVLEGEWTVEVAMADALLRDGLAEWVAALDRIESHWADGDARGARAELAALEEANRKLIYVERLQALFPPG